MSNLFSDEELLDALLHDPYFDRLDAKQLKAFSGMKARGRSLSELQRHWVRGVAERFGIQVAPSENIFSAMDPEKQARQREAAKRIRLPWEK